MRLFLGRIWLTGSLPFGCWNNGWWFSGGLIYFLPFFYYSYHNVFTELEFRHKPMKMGNDENIYETGTGLSQIHWWQKQDLGLVSLALDTNLEYYWTRGSIFCYLWTFCTKYTYPEQNASPLFQFVGHMRCAVVGKKHCQDMAWMRLEMEMNLSHRTVCECCGV